MQYEETMNLTVAVRKTDGERFRSGGTFRVISCDFPDPTAIRPDVGL
jgi:hypothetical protein